MPVMMPAMLFLALHTNGSLLSMMSSALIATFAATFHIGSHGDKDVAGSTDNFRKLFIVDSHDFGFIGICPTVWTCIR